MISFIQRRDGPLQRGVRMVMVLAILLFQFGPTVTLVMANPQGEQVISGQASFDRSGNSLTIHTSDRVIIHWQDFSIQSGELTKFVQPSVNSAALNRVISGNPSSIFGTLQSNGKIYLINPNGILVGPGAHIDTGGFIASTLDVSNEEFMQGGNMTFMGNSMASVENRGSINAIGGDIFLIAREVNNSGEINAPDGTVGLAAGQEVLIGQTGDDRVFVRPTAGAVSAQGISNSGVLAAARVELEAHGNLYALAINNTGTVRANGATIGADGRVFLTANGGTVRVGGTVEAKSAGGKGGTVAVAAERVEIDEAHIDVSGETGGGSVKVGGGYQGKDASIENSQSTTVSAGTVINASATDNGDGGQVVLWSDGTTDFDGTILARGGPNGGNGGFAEVSGKDLLNYHGFTDLRADNGEVGHLLLDPKFILIRSDGTDPVAGNSQFSDNAAGTSTISGADLSTAIDSASVTLQANTDIEIDDNVTATTAGNGLTLQAGRSIIIDANRILTLNGGDFVATINDSNAQAANRDAGGSIFSMQSGSQILTQGGNVTVTYDPSGLATGFSFGVELNNATISTGAGNVMMVAKGGDTGDFNIGILLTQGSIVQTTSGDITLNGTGGSGGNDNWGVDLEFNSTTVKSDSGLITITGQGGGSGSENFGVFLKDTAVVQNNTGGINITGTGAAGTTLDHGVAIQDSGTAVTSVDGNISITGQGGAGSQELNFGIRVMNGADISSTGTGNITLGGTGGLGAWGNHGVSISGTGTDITTFDGDISITGTGADAAGGFNVGVLVDGWLTVQSTGLGDVTLQGTGGNGGANGDNWGVFVQGTPVNPAKIAVVEGTASITGTGNGTTDQNNIGVYLNQKVEVVTTGTSGTSTIMLTGSGAGSAPGIKATSDTTLGGPAFYGAMWIEANTASGSDAIELGGASIQNEGNDNSSLFFVPGTAGMDVGLAGGSGTFNLSTAELDGIQDGLFQLAIGRADGAGTFNVGSYTFKSSLILFAPDAGGAGTININGDVVLTGHNEYIQLEAGKNITVSGGSLVTNDGGIYLSANPSGTYAGWSMGVDINNGSTLSAGDGWINIYGKGGDAPGDWKIGIRVQGSTIESTGSMVLEGTGGTQDSYNPGILVEWSGGKITTTDGDIMMTGVGGGTGSNNWGVSISDGGAVTVTGSGDLTINGTGGNGTDVNYGVKLTGGSLVSVGTGDMDIHGNVVNASGIYNHGLDIDSGAQVLSTDGEILMFGGGGWGTHDNNGVRIADSGTLIQSSGAGRIHIDGYAGHPSQELNRGMVIEGGAHIESTGTGKIELFGLGFLGAWGNHGLTMAGSGTVISSVDGDISIAGQGADVAGGWNNGVWIFQGAQVQASGNSSIYVQGVGGDSGANGDNWGVMIEDAGTKLTAADGIHILGIGHGTTDQNNVGIYVRNGAQIESTGSGTIWFEGYGNNSAPGIRIDNVAMGGSLATGMIKLQAETQGGADSIELSNFTAQSSGELFLSPINGSDGIGLAGASGVFNLSSSELDSFQDGFSQITIGHANGNAFVNVDSYTFNDPIKIQSNSAGGGVISVNGALATSTAGDSIELYGGRGVVVNGGLTTDGGDITIKGNDSGTASGFSFGVDINGVTISSGTGNVDITGIGGDSGAFNIGIRLTNGASIQTTSGDITLNGTGGAGDHFNWGSLVEWSSSISTSNGHISITGGSRGTGDENYAVYLQGSSTISSNTGDIDIMGTSTTAGGSGNNGVRVNFSSIVTNDGDITITGVGGGSGNDNYGVLLHNGGSVEALGAGNVTIDGTGGDGTWWNVGTYIINSGTYVRTDTGDINITGTGGNGSFDSNFGILMASTAQVSTTSTGNITMTGNGGNATWGNHGLAILDPGTGVSTVNGDITLAGNGGNGSQGWNVGMRLQNDVFVTSSGNGNITLTGTATGGVEDNWGFWAENADITAVNGDITITGTGVGTDHTNYGIFATGGTHIESTGDGLITMTGTGGNGTWWNVGTYITDSGTYVRSVQGDIDISGTGGDGTINENFGVLLASGALIDSTDSAKITINGTGGNGTWGNHGVMIVDGGTAINTVDGDISITGTGGSDGTDNWNVGVRIQNGPVIASTGHGKIDINGFGANGVLDNWGVWMNAARVTSALADVSIQGFGGAGSAQTNYGIFLENGAVVENTGAGDVTVGGTGGAADWGNHGVFMQNAGTEVSVQDGDLIMVGYGGDGTGGFNVGVRLTDFATVDAKNNGTVAILGTGGYGTDDNWGVAMDSGASVTTATGDINITGFGDGTGNTNYGVYLQSGAFIDNFGAGDVTVTGTGGNGGALNYGIYLTNAGTEMCTEDGNLLALGYGGNGSGSGNVGVYITDFAAVEACNNGTVTIQGIAGNGTDDNVGIWANNGLVTSITGDITITGLGNGSGVNNMGIYLETGTDIISFDTANITLDGRGVGMAEGIKAANASNSIGGGAMTGDITIFADTETGADSIDLSGVTLQSAGAAFLQPLNTSTNIGVGDGASGVFNLSSTELANLQDGFASIRIGSAAGTGAVDVSMANFSDPISILGGPTTINGPVDAGFENLLIKANGGIALNGTITAGNATLVTNSGFFNSAGPTPFTLNGGYFLIYSVKPSNNVLGGLLFDFEKFGVSYPTPPGIIGNGLLYSWSPAGGNSQLDNFMNTTFQQFTDSYDRINRLDESYLDMPDYYPGGGSFGYGPGYGPPPTMQDAIAYLSSFDLSKVKKPGEEE